MNTTLPTKRKLIDLPTSTLRTLSIKASIEGTNVKNYIERLLLIEADRIERMTDYRIYKNLLETDPNGKVFLNEAETLAFEKRLGL